jgi:hypothetical protein
VGSGYLQVVFGVLTIAGVVVLVGAFVPRRSTGDLQARRESARVAQRSRRDRAIVGCVALTLGIAGQLVRRSFTGANRRDSTISTATEFSSGDFPAIELTTPTGWQLRTVLPAGNVWAYGSSHQMLSIRSELSEEVFEPRKLADVFKQSGRAMGLGDMEDTREAIVSGLPALVVGMHASDGENAIFIVKRGRRFSTTLTCSVPPNEDPHTGCQAVIERIKWIRPANVSSDDL